MAINKKLIHFKNKQKFNEELAKGNILDTSIVFILDTKEIYTHGQYYGDLSKCLTKYPQEFTKEEKDQILENLGYYFIEWDGESTEIELSDEEYAKLNASTIPLLVAGGVQTMYPTTFVPGLFVAFRMDIANTSATILIDFARHPVLTFEITETTIPSYTSDLENDSNFISSDNLKTINGESILGSGNIAIQGGGIESETDPVFTASPAASITNEKIDEWNDKVDKSTLAKVATSGSYDDLTNKPTIPSAVTESTVSGWGFTKNTGTITLIKANGTNIATSGEANIPAASTSVYGVTKLSSSTSSTSTGLAATASAVKSAYDLANSRQEKLVSGTNIKTINGESLLGNGDITLSGGFAGANVQAVDTEDVVDDVNISYATLAYVDSAISNIVIQGGGGNAVETITPFTDAIAFLGTEQRPSMKANTIYVQGGTANLDSLNFLEISSFEETSDVYAEYIIIFMFNNTTQGDPSITLPDYVNWANGKIPTIEANVVYELNIAKSIVAGEIKYCAILVPFKTV